MPPRPRHEGIKTGYESGRRGVVETVQDLEDAVFDYDPATSTEQDETRIKRLVDEALLRGVTIEPVLSSIFAAHPELYAKVLQTTPEK